MTLHHIDINPGANNTEEGISRVHGNEIDPQHPSFKYEKLEGGSFDLYGLSYGNKKLTGILPCVITVKSVTTHFGAENNILLIHLAIDGGTHTYYMNQDTKLGLENVIFSKFVPNNAGLYDSELKEVLKNIEANNGLNLAELGKGQEIIAKKLFGDNGIIFNLKHDSPSIPYFSEVTETRVSLESKSLAGGHYKIEHKPNHSPFNLRGIMLPDGNYMKVDGGFPNDTFTRFCVYYGIFGKGYEDPLLIVLDVKSTKDGREEKDEEYITIQYYLSKNSGSTTWKTLRIAGSGMNDMKGLPDLISSIENNHKINIDELGDDTKYKLKDITRDVTIDFTQIKENTEYTSIHSYENAGIPYKKELSAVDNYSIIRSCYTFPSFTIKNILTGLGKIGPEKLPPVGIVFEEVNGYCTSSSCSDVVLIELKCLKNTEQPESRMYVYYYLKERNGWNVYLLRTTAEESKDDLTTILKEIEVEGKRSLEEINGIKAKVTKLCPSRRQISGGTGMEGCKDREKQSNVLGYSVGGALLGVTICISTFFGRFHILRLFGHGARLAS